MSDEIFKRVGNDLSEQAIRGIIHDEITSHRESEAALPIIKFKPIKQEEVIKIHKLSAQEAPMNVFRVGGAGELLKGTGEATIKLPDTLTSSQKLKKAFRYRRYGEPLRAGKLKRAQLPMPAIKEEERRKLKWFRLKKMFFGIELIIPAVVLFLLFSWLPIIKTFTISLRKFTTINESVYTGMANFTKIMTDQGFWSAFQHSLLLSLMIIVMGTGIPFFIALYVNEMKKGSGLMKVIYFLPFLTPAVPAAILWKWMYNQGFGLINSLLSLMFGHVNIGWLTNPKLALFSIAIVFVWKNIGWAMLIYLAGMQNLSKSLFEDSSLLGADVWTKIRTIVVPGLLPVIVTVIFIQIVSGMQVFAEVYVMTNGGPEGASEVIATYIYKKAFLYMDIGYASGVAVFFLLILISISLFRMNLTGNNNGKRKIK
jgi:ABC-type sugar transport system permease subunit